MNFTASIRGLHRWIGLLFALTVAANFLVRPFGEPPAFVTYAPLAPLFASLFSGLWLFVRPYAARR